MTESLAPPPSPRRLPLSHGSLLLLSPLPSLQSGSLDAAAGFKESRIVNAASFVRQDDLGTPVRVVDPAKSFARYGSSPQTHGDPFGSLSRASGAGGQRGLGKPASWSDRRGGLYQTVPNSKNEIEKQPSSLETDSLASPIDIDREGPDRLERKVLRKLQRGKSFSTDLDRDAAWEHKRELYLMGYEALGSNVTQTRTIASGSACNTGHKTWPQPSIKSLPRTRTRSLTDEDLEELRGSIDLGFGFSNDESYDLKSTLPALELYYAINRQYADAKIRSSPVSPLDGMALRRTYSADGPRDSSREILRICNPGDHPSQVKIRLRHWAQAVACSVKQGY